MSKLRTADIAQWDDRPGASGRTYLFHCPGCGYGHRIDVRTDGLRPSWTFDGNLDAPTFSPSLLIRSVKLPPRDPATNDFPKGPDGKYVLDEQGRIAGTQDTVCHSFIRAGRIEYLGDCTHELAGQVVEMADVDA